MSEHSYSCDTSGMRNQHIPVRGIPDALNPDYSRPQPPERTAAWWTLGTALLIASTSLVACDSRTEEPSAPVQIEAPAFEVTEQSRPTSILDALGPVALNG